MGGTSDPDDDDYQPDPSREAHIDRLHHELRWLPCGETCANWLRYGVQPKCRRHVKTDPYTATEN